MDVTLKKFEPGTFIEIDDSMRGFRKLGLVTEGGDMYFDDASDTATPFPIYDALRPAAVGNALSWGLELADRFPSEQPQYIELQQRLLDAGLDTITVNRALYWAYMNHNYEYSRALAAGRAASAEVVNSRVMMDRLIAKAANA